MFKANYNDGLPFNLETELEYIASKAALYISQGNKDIWIYFIEVRCHCHIIELPVISQFFIAHYKCDKFLKSLSKAEWKKLEHKILKARKEGLKLCHPQKP